MHRNPIFVVLFLTLSTMVGLPLSAETPRKPLTTEQIGNIPKSLPAWEAKDKHLERTIEFPSFLKLIEFVNKITTIAEAMEHHPDMDIRYKKLTLLLSTHDIDGISALDLDLAKKIDTALGQAGN